MCAVGSLTTERVTQYVGEQGKENRWPDDQPREGARDAQRPQPTWLSSKRGLAAVTGERLEIERLTSRSEEGRWKSTHRGNSLAAYPTARAVLRGLRLASAYSPAVCNGGPDKAQPAVRYRVLRR